MSTTEYVGWHRPNGHSPWRPVCHGASAEVVLTKLLDSVRGGDKMVLAGGIDANERQSSIRRRRF